MTKDELPNKLKEHGLALYEKELEAAGRPCIRLYLTKTDESEIPLGASKMGGRPDLPESLSWPYETERPANDRDRFFNQKRDNKPLLPLSFIAQINLADVSPLDDDNLLPESGILYFFYSAEQEVWGFDPRDTSGFKVLFYDGDEASLRRIDFPDDLPDYSRFHPCALSAAKGFDLPTPWSEETRGLFKTEEEENAYNEFHSEWPVNKLFGYADVQGEMEIEGEMVTGGDYVGDGVGREDPRRKSAEARLGDWRLLLQVDSNEEDCGMMWGDLGRLYYWIRKADLLNRNFEKSWLILQCS